MRAVAIVGARGVHHQGLLGVVEPGEIRHRRVEAEEIVELQRGVVAVTAQREFAVQVGVIGIADRADGGEAVERAAQDDDDEARIARARRARPARDAGGGEGRGGDAASRERRLRWGKARTWLPPLEFGREDQQRIGLLGLSARITASRVAGRRVGPRMSSTRARRARRVLELLRELRGELEPRLHALGRGPGVGVVAEAVGPGGLPKRHAQQVQRVQRRAGSRRLRWKAR